MFARKNIIFLILLCNMSLAFGLPASLNNINNTKASPEDNLNTTQVNKNNVRKIKEDGQLKVKDDDLGTNKALVVNKVPCDTCGSRSINAGTTTGETNDSTDSTLIVYPTEIDKEQNVTMTYAVGDLDDRFGLPGSLVATMLG